MRGQMLPEVDMLCQVLQFRLETVQYRQHLFKALVKVPPKYEELLPRRS
jgi:hypothetical protein